MNVVMLSVAFYLLLW